MKKTFFLLIFLFLSQSAQADIILLKNGEIIEGKVTQVRGIFLRVESDYRRPFREFLIENVANIETTNTDEISQLAVRNIHNRAINKARDQRLQDAIDKKAGDLIGEVIQSAEKISLNEVSDEVKSSAQQKANVLIEEAVKSTETPPLESTSEELRGAAEEKASGIIAQAVKNVEISSLQEAPNDVQIAAKQAATVLIEEAVMDVNNQSRNRTFDKRNESIAVKKVGTFKAAQQTPTDTLKGAVDKQASLISLLNVNPPDQEMLYTGSGLTLRDQIMGGMIVLLLLIFLSEKIKNRKKEEQTILELKAKETSHAKTVTQTKTPEPKAKGKAWTEKRKHLRENCDTPIVLIMDKIKSIPVTLKNISIGGACAVCDDINLLRRLGDQCQYQFQVASKDPNFNLGGRAEVVRIKSDRDLGLKFLELDDDSVNYLRKFCFQ